jgi:hypothetical protein
MLWLKRLLIVLAVLLAFAAIAVFTAPADWLYRHFAAPQSGVVLHGVHGTLWSGSAERVSAFTLPLGALSWRIDRWPTLIGRPRGMLELRGANIEGRAHFAQTGDALRVDDLHGRFPASLLGPAMDIPGLQFLGEVRFDLNRLEIVDGIPRVAVGTASWTQLGVAGGAQAQLPGLKAELSELAPEGILIELSDLGGALEVQGHTRMQHGKFRTEVRLRAREPNAQLEEMLTYIGERHPDGGSLLIVEGEALPLY